MFKKFFVFFAFGFMASVISAANFDDVVWNSKVVEEKVEAGFGARFLLEVVGSKEVSGPYQELSKLGHVHIFAQKLLPQNQNESKTTRLTFEAWQPSGFSEAKKVKTLVVDCFSETGFRDGGSTHYRIISNN